MTKMAIDTKYLGKACVPALGGLEQLLVLVVYDFMYCIYFFSGQTYSVYLQTFTHAGIPLHPFALGVLNG